MSLHPSTAPSMAVGDYIIGHEIGRGSFATVYMGKTIATGHPVAVKSVSREKLNRKLMENLESEIKILKGIQHEHVVALLDIMKTDKHIHLIMEYCSLGDLSNYIKKRGLVGGLQVEAGQWNPMSSVWGGLNDIIVRDFLKQLASAMEFLRAHDLIHRDLKPQNVLLCPGPFDAPGLQIPSFVQPGTSVMLPPLPVLKLADFGFARALPAHSLASTLCGSPLYMAPEILRGDKYGPSADLWSFGAILYEMICGRPPFKAQNHIDLLRKIDRGEGYIRFPGEGAIAAPAHRNSLSSSPSSRLGYSPSSSPRFLAPSGAQALGDDLKDLVRKLLKRVPAERMSFEAFFSHPCVISNRSLASASGPSSYDDGFSLRRKSSSGSHRSIRGGTPPWNDSPSGATSDAHADTRHPAAISEGFGQAFGQPDRVDTHANKFVPVALQRVHTSPARPEFKRGETLILGMPHDTAQQQRAMASESKSSSHHHKTSYGGPSFAPMLPRHFGGPVEMTRQVSAPPLHPIKGSIGDSSNSGSTAHIHASIIPPFSTGGSVPAQTTSSTQHQAHHINVEAPFPEYGQVDPAIFGASVKPSSNVEPEHLAVSTPDEPLEGSRGEENNSSLSSLGSLELSEVDEHDVYDDNGDAGGPKEQNASGSKSSTTGSTGTNNGKASIEEYVVVEKRVVEVNWLADEVAGAFRGTEGQGSTATFPAAAHAPVHYAASEAVLSRASDLQPTPSTDVPSLGLTPPTPLGQSPRSLRISPKQQSRIFGSLRESTHQFLNSPGPSSGHPTSSPLPTTTPPQAYTAAASSAGSPGRNVAGGFLSSPRSAADSDQHSLLTPLNLCALRGHAVQQLADSLAPTAPSEALGCYLLALRCYQTGIEVAKGIWEGLRSARSSSRGLSMSTATMVGMISASVAGGGYSSPSSASAVDLKVLSVGVQWVRERFNECLDRAERCGVDADDTSGRRVEMVVYEGALEVSRQAALLELSSNPPPSQCEDMYRHAILLIEALLSVEDYSDTDSAGTSSNPTHLPPSISSSGSSASARPTGIGTSSHHTPTMTDDDRRVLERFVASLWARVGSVAHPTSPTAAK
ncbi:uncharacterized protein EV422DRAFT_569180 [Fimicolochytrium jonesii]|uniref:uncharacterized protein n=1 Tax=Fimicolochytrium jonesii TaxID=1396493 RepID=UPI0022FE5B3C|nr:uncharacterized protein EV422DRAFT_569180 [Fimicolochytrium jonesii]KAI8818907.1 hypothetical protein EV422DRAFT_569180 [Fimicolochytrium jonesii]